MLITRGPGDVDKELHRRHQSVLVEIAVIARKIKIAQDFEA